MFKVNEDGWKIFSGHMQNVWLLLIIQNVDFQDLKRDEEVQNKREIKTKNTGFSCKSLHFIYLRDPPKAQ